MSGRTPGIPGTTSMSLSKRALTRILLPRINVLEDAMRSRKAL
jgi:hypothetical protein